MSTLIESALAQRAANPFSLHCQWFGKAMVFAHNGESQTSVELSPRTIALLALLDCSGRKVWRNDDLAGLLWPRKDLIKARHSLSNAFSELSKNARAHVVTSGQERRLTVDTTSDRVRFIELARAGSWDDVEKCYRGSFLEGLESIADSDGMLEFITEERARLDLLFQNVAGKRIRALLDTGKPRDAVRLAAEVTRRCAFNQATRRLQIEALVVAGEHDEANAEAEALLARLQVREEPVHETTHATIRQARAGAVNRSSNGTAQREGTIAGSINQHLVGRELVFERIVEATALVKRTGTTEWLHVEAPPGLGKTRLLHEVGRRMRALGVETVEVRAHPGERDISHSTSASLVTAVARKRGARDVNTEVQRILVSLAPAVGDYFDVTGIESGNASDVLHRRILAVADLLLSVSRRRTVMLLLDDVHWMDDESRKLLLAVIERSRHAGLVIVSAGRADSPLTMPVSARIQLNPFDRDDVAELLTRIATLPDSHWASELPAKLAAATAGSPLLIGETLQRADEAGLLRPVDGRWTCADAHTLFALVEQRAVLHHRIGTLTEEAARTLIALAVAGTPIDERATLTFANIEALRELEQKGLARLTASGWEVSHDEIADAAILNAAPESVERAHRSIADALGLDPRADKGVLLRVIRHAVLGKQQPSRRILTQFVSNARARGDHRSTRALLGSALRDTVGRADVVSMTKSLPLMHRYEWARTGRIAAGILACVLLGAAWGAQSVSAERALVEQSAPTLLMTDGSDTGQYAVRWSPANWRTRHRLVATRTSNLLFKLPRPDFQMLGASIPDSAGRRVLSLYDSTTGSFSIAILSPDGAIARVDEHPADDVRPQWAVGGNVVFSSRRWDSVSHRSEIAYWSRSGDYVQPLTSGPGDKLLIAVSADGRQYLYSVDGQDKVPSVMLCWAPLPGFLGDKGCVTPSFGTVDPLARGVWDRQSAIVQLLHLRDDGIEQRALARVSLQDGKVTVIATGASDYWPSPDSRWFYSTETSDGQAVGYLTPMVDPDGKRLVTMNSRSTAPVAVAWDAPMQRDREVATVRITSRPLRLRVDESYQVQFEAMTLTGALLDGSAVSLRAIDTALLAVDGHRVIPRRVGATFLIAELGKVRDTVKVDIDSATKSRVVLEEYWTAPLSSSWNLHGSPLPRIVRVNGISALEPNGDQTHVSAVSSKYTIDATEGAGVEIRVQLPLSAPMWQRLTLSLDGGMHDSILKKFAPGSDAPPQGWDGDVASRCIAAYPAREYSTGIDKLLHYSGSSSTTISAPHELRDGKIHRIRLQLMRDGRCRVAIDGRALAWAGTPASFSRLRRIVISGSSVNTRIRVVSLVAWEGVRTDIKW